MADDKVSMSVRIRLSAMMFLQFMMFAVFWQQLAPYLDTFADMSSWQKSLILSSMAIGCLASPIIGMVADRYFASQRVLFVVNFLGGGLLLLAAVLRNPTLVFIVLLLYMLCYMPTWGLTSAIAMANSPAEQFPQIRVFGSLGWFSSVIFSVAALYVFGVKIDGTTVHGMNIPLICGAAVSIVGALVALTIPNTPPPAKGKPFSVVDALGLRSITLMKDVGFAVFIIASLLVMIPFGMDWSYFGDFLGDRGFTLITWTTYLGRALEIVFMLFVPLALARMGVKWAMSVGLVALVVRYTAYWGSGVIDQTWLMYMGILVHGLIYGFFFVGGQVYINKKAPKEIQAQAQGFIFLVTFGAGLIVANFVNGKLIERLKVERVVEGVVQKSWDSIWLVMMILSAAVLVAFVLFFWGKVTEKEGGDGKPQEEPATAG